MTNYDLLLQRRMAIENGLLELMQLVPYGQISVTSLTQHLHMSRKSFYHYFPGKEACLDSLVSRIIQECALFISDRGGLVNDMYQGFLQNLYFWQGQQLFLNALVKNNLMPVFLRHCMHHVESEEKQLLTLLSTPDTACDEDVLLYFLNGHLTLLLNWCARDFETPPEDLARKLVRLTCRPLIQHTHNPTK